MSLEAYDKAMFEKVKTVYPNTVFSPMTKALEVSAKTESITEDGDGSTVGVNSYRDQMVAFPLIAIDRVNQSFAMYEQQRNDPAIRRGRFVLHDDEPEREHTFPVTLNYQIDVLSNERREVDGIWRELVYYLYTHPTLRVEFEWNKRTYHEDAVLHLSDTDNTTDVEEFSDRGRIYRITTNIEVPDAKLLFVEPIYLVDEFPIRLIARDDLFVPDN